MTEKVFYKVMFKDWQQIVDNDNIIGFFLKSVLNYTEVKSNTELNYILVSIGNHINPDIVDYESFGWNPDDGGYYNIDGEYIENGYDYYIRNGYTYRGNYVTHLRKKKLEKLNNE